MQVHHLPLIPGEHPLDRAARYLGGRPLLAKALDVTPAAIGNWKTRGVPIEKCVPIERLCPGVLSRRDLRDDWADIWPELAVSQPESGQPLSALNATQQNPHPAQAATQQDA